MVAVVNPLGCDVSEAERAARMCQEVWEFATGQRPYFPDAEVDELIFATRAAKAYNEARVYGHNVAVIRPAERLIPALWTLWRAGDYGSTVLPPIKLRKDECVGFVFDF